MEFAALAARTRRARPLDDAIPSGRRGRDCDRAGRGGVQRTHAGNAWHYAGRWSYFDHERQVAFSVVLNGLLFLALMLASERSASLDLRRAGKWLEVLAIVHTISALFANAMSHEGNPLVRVDVWLYLAAALFFAVLAPFRSRWRMLVGGLAGCGLGSYLLVRLDLVARKTVHHRTGPPGFGGGIGGVHLREARNEGGRAIYKSGERKPAGIEPACHHKFLHSLLSIHWRF